MFIPVFTLTSLVQLFLKLLYLSCFSPGLRAAEVTDVIMVYSAFTNDIKEEE